MPSYGMLFSSVALVVHIAGTSLLFGRYAEAQTLKNDFVFSQKSRSDEIETLKLSNKMWYSTMALAFNASTCGLRSERWWQAFDLWNQRRLQMNSNRLNLSTVEEKEMEAEADTTWQAVVAKNTCATVASQLNELDAMHDRITLGYR